MKSVLPRFDWWYMYKMYLVFQESIVNTAISLKLVYKGKSENIESHFSEFGCMLGGANVIVLVSALVSVV